MSLPNRQIGWSQESNLLYEVLRQLNKMECLFCGGGGTTTTTTTVPLVPRRCSSPTVNVGIMEKSWDDQQLPDPPSGIYTFEIVDLTLNDVQYGTGQTITITAPDDLVTGLGLDGITVYVMNINDWINSITGVAASGFVFYDDMTTIDSPDISYTYSVIIKRTVVRNSGVYYYGWINDGINIGWGFGDSPSTLEICYTACFNCTNI